jgi:rhodanese-related sulfurtransferase
MRKRLSALTLNQRLAALAVVLGAVAIGARPYQGATVTIDSGELASIVARDLDHVDPLELADWIITQRGDYRLIDVRDEQAYATYHIPGAEPVPVTSLDDYPLMRSEKIVLYSDDGVHAAQAWFLLKAKGYPGVYILRGGLDAWVDTVLFPALGDDPAEKRRGLDRRASGAAAGRNAGRGPGRAGEEKEEGRLLRGGAGL